MTFVKLVGKNQGCMEFENFSVFFFFTFLLEAKLRLSFIFINRNNQCITMLYLLSFLSEDD